MSTDIKALMKLIGGKESTPESVQRLQAIMHAADMSRNDPMVPIFVSLDCYYGAFNELPERAQQAANEIAKNSAQQAKQLVDTVVAGALIPVASRAFEKGVEKYTGILEQAAARKSIGIVAAAGVGVLLVGLVVGWLGGSWSRGEDDRIAIDAAAVAQTGVTAKLQATVNADQAVMNKAATDAAAVVATANDSDRWARTEQGRLAFKFFTEGGGLLAAKCQGEHWSQGTTEKGEKLCMPDNKTFWGNYSRGDTGWVIP